MTTAIAKTSEGAWMVAPSNMDEAYRFAETVAKSDLAPRDFRGKPGNVLVAIQLGAEIGLSPISALQNIAVINGRPTVWGDAQLALVRAHPSFVSYSEVPRGTKGGNDRAWTCTLKRRMSDGAIEVTTGEFTWADAVKAKLANKAGPWMEYPDRMIKMRARSWCLRDGATDILKGIAQREEAQDMEPIAGNVVSAAPVGALPVTATEPEPKPPQEDPHARYWFKGNKHTGQPIAELSDESLGNYIARLEKCVASNGEWSEKAKPYLAAAEAELERRIQVDHERAEAEQHEVPAQDPSTEDEAPADDMSAASDKPDAVPMVEYVDPETGEVRTAPADSIEGQLALSLATKGTDRTDANESWGMADGMPTKAKAETRTKRKEST